MSDKQQLVGKYLGKQLVKETPTYKRYKFQFQVNDKNVNVFAFGPDWNKKDGNPKAGINPFKDMEEGKEYKVSYEEYQGETMDYPAKTGLNFYNADDKSAPSSVPTNQIKSTATKVQFNPTDFTEIIDAYFQLAKEKQEMNHFIGTIIRTINPELVKPLMDEFDKRTKK